MKFSTRARYGLRMMVELARALEKEELVHLGRIADVTGLSDNYLAQLAISLKSNGLLIGVSGKKGGYQLARPPQDIKIRDILMALIGPINITDCVDHPEICLNSCFCEARAIWVLVSESIMKTLEEYTLADLLDKDWLTNIRAKHPDMDILNPESTMTGKKAKTYRSQDKFC